MKCPKCGYNSFDYNESCPHCNRDLSGLRRELNLLDAVPQSPPFLAALIGGAEAEEGGEFTFEGEETEMMEATETSLEAEATMETEAAPEETAEGISFVMPPEEVEQPAIEEEPAAAFEETTLDLGEEEEPGPALGLETEEADLDLGLDEEELEVGMTLETEESALELPVEEEEPAMVLEEEPTPDLGEAETVIMEESPFQEAPMDLSEEPEDLSADVARVEAEVGEEEKVLDLSDLDVGEAEVKEEPAPVETGKRGEQTVIMEAETPPPPESNEELKVIPLSETMEEELDLSDLQLGPDSDEESLDLGEIEKLDLSGLEEESEIAGFQEEELDLSDVIEGPAEGLGPEDVELSEEKTVILDETPPKTKTPSSPDSEEPEEIELDLSDLKIDD